MLGALLSQEIALDLGSARTRVHLRGTGCVVDIPTVAAIRTRRSGRRELLAVGDTAQQLVGRAPDGIRTVRPVRAGRIVEPEAVDALLGHVFAGLYGRKTWFGPRVLATAPPDAAEPELRALRDACLGIGARDVQLLPRPIAAAVGADVAPEGTSGHMLVDIGAGTTHVAVLCGGEVVVSTTLDVAGDVLDGAIIRMLRRDHALLVGTPTAERLKVGLGGAVSTFAVGGRCLRRGVPRAIEVAASEVGAALAEPLSAIGAAIRRVLEQTPPEIASDVVDHGVLLTGGGSLVRDLELSLRASTGLAMLPCDAPERAVIRGAGRLLDRSGGLGRASERARRASTVRWLEPAAS